MKRAAIIILLLLTACETEDSSAVNACSHLSNVVVDADILNDIELREKLQEVNDSASLSDDAAVREAARGMLAAITQDDMSDFRSAISDMTAACGEYLEE